jgi:N-acetyl-gamma-glutamyl-phosphate reductase
MASNQPNVFIDGEAGATGVAIRQLLEMVPEIVLRSLPAAQRKDPSARQDIMAECDLVVLCLPDDAAREAVALAGALGNDAPKLLDASTAHRVDPEWTYGFPEMSPDQPRKIAKSPQVANPGCYPTGAIGLLRPSDYPISISAVSGYSGGGRSMIEAHDRAGGPAFELYALGLEHKHVPEIEFFATLSRRPIFIPSVGHFRQGMLVSVPLYLDDLPGKPSGADLQEALRAFYEGSEHVTVGAGSRADKLEPEALNGTNQLDLYVCANEARRQAVLIAQLDNLGKGASGAAVQNLRLMLDLDSGA